MSKTILFFFVIVCISGILARPNPKPKSDDGDVSNDQHTVPGGNGGDPIHNRRKRELLAKNDGDDDVSLADYQEPGANGSHDPGNRLVAKANDDDSSSEGDVILSPDYIYTQGDDN
ncbi:uncharacterized protein LOC108736625 isoform X1 [Agrilus planipennis]|uniref:Uncharacterized protein LOC108736625 isoform X1 n=1 Tax=Agrilus planipennis TaxID=224129 RepID=A0A1W4WWU5_AGRPL|nr:uncharacterized protein LOC108736625 isoform X1 [Agrilus planipennis]